MLFNKIIEELTLIQKKSNKINTQEIKIFKVVIKYEHRKIY